MFCTLSVIRRPEEVHGLWRCWKVSHCILGFYLGTRVHTLPRQTEVVVGGVLTLRYVQKAVAGKARGCCSQSIRTEWSTAELQV